MTLSKVIKELETYVKLESLKTVLSINKLKINKIFDCVLINMPTEEFLLFL